MSEQDTPTSPLTRMVPGLTLIALIVMISGAIFHVFTLRPAQAPGFSRETAPKAPDFFIEEGWLERPSTTKAGGWDKPWGVDLFWFTGAGENYTAGWNTPIDWVGSDLSFESEASWPLIFNDAFALFSPRLRHAASLNGSSEDYEAARALENEDALSAFDFYADHDHQLRGVFIGGREQGVETASQVYTQRILGTPVFNDLFGGVIVADSGDNKVSDLFPGLENCNDAANFPCLLNISGLSGEEAGERVNRLMTDFSLWLDDHAAKPAEPFPPMETIEIAPINKTDQ